MVKRVLLLVPTKTYRVPDFLAAGQSLGLDLVIGTEEPLPLLSLNPNSSLILDFHHTQESVRSIVSWVEDHPIDAITSADDDYVEIAALASAELGLPHHTPEAVRIADDKQRMRELLASAGLPSPTHVIVEMTDDVSTMLENSPAFPVVLKPTFLNASRGVIRVDDETQFVQALERIRALFEDPAIQKRGKDRTGLLLIEEYIDGEEVAVEGMMIDGKFQLLAIFDKPDTLEGPYFEETYYITPSRKPERIQHDIVDLVSRTCHAIGLSHGSIHAEVRLSSRGPILVEIAARSIGGLCSRALRFGDDLSLEELILSYAAGLPISSMERQGEAAGVLMLPIPNRGILQGWEGEQESRDVEGIEDLVFTIPRGSEVVPLPEGNRYLGFLFARHETPEEAEKALRSAYAKLNIRIEPDDDEGPGLGQQVGEKAQV